MSRAFKEIPHPPMEYPYGSCPRLPVQSKVVKTGISPCKPTCSRRFPWQCSVSKNFLQEHSPIFHIGSFFLSPYRQPAHIEYLNSRFNFKLVSKSTNNQTDNWWGDIITENKTQDYFDDKGEGHVDTREANFNRAFI
jgi:hypothetical protein